MKYILLTSIFFLSGMNSFAQAFEKIPDTRPKTEINWVKKLKGDFSFTQNWEFPMGVETKADGKAGCADGGFCPERCYGMLDSNGIVLKDSATIFYSLLDTTHIPFSIQCESSCSEFAGTNIVYAVKKTGRFRAVTSTDVATHCSLDLSMDEKFCVPTVYLNSITETGTTSYHYKKGELKIDKNEFNKNILKAEFDLEFYNQDDPTDIIFWRGKIHSPIQKQQ